MLLQRSRFTIHGTPEPLNELFPKSMMRCTIPAGSREKVRDELLAAGITNRSLFPDLGTLARDLTEEAILNVQRRERSQKAFGQ